MADDALRSNRKYASANTPFNAISFLVQGLLKGELNTCIPVRVIEVLPREEEAAVAPPEEGGEEEKEDRFPQPDAVGFVSALPLVCPYTAAGATGKPEVLKPTIIPRLPYMRVQGGLAAVVNDPQPGDIGIAVFAQQDISKLFKPAPSVVEEGQEAPAGGDVQEPVAPASFRTFDMSDGIYLGGILNKAPVAWIQFKYPEGEGEEGEDPKVSLNVKAVGPLEMKTLDEFYVEATSLLFKSAQGMEFRATQGIKLLAKEDVALMSQKTVTVNAGESITCEIKDVEFPDDEQPEDPNASEEEQPSEPPAPGDKKIVFKVTDGNIEMEAKKVLVKASDSVDIDTAKTHIKGNTEISGDLKVSGAITGSSVEAPSVKAGGKEMAGHTHTAPQGGGTTSGPN